MKYFILSLVLLAGCSSYHQSPPVDVECGQWSCDDCVSIVKRLDPINYPEVCRMLSDGKLMDSEHDRLREMLEQDYMAKRIVDIMAITCKSEKQ